ncbi:hypothetical protein PCE1_003823 [Barthelona sp. PCE]
MFLKIFAKPNSEALVVDLNENSTLLANSNLFSSIFEQFVDTAEEEDRHLDIVLSEFFDDSDTALTFFTPGAFERLSLFLENIDYLQEYVDCRSTILSLREDFEVGVNELKMNLLKEDEKLVKNLQSKLEKHVILTTKCLKNETERLNQALRRLHTELEQDLATRREEFHTSYQETLSILKENYHAVSNPLLEKTIELQDIALECGLSNQEVIDTLILSGFLAIAEVINVCANFIAQDFDVFKDEPNFASLVSKTLQQEIMTMASQWEVTSLPSPQKGALRSLRMGHIIIKDEERVPVEPVPQTTVNEEDSTQHLKNLLQKIKRNREEFEEFHDELKQSAIDFDEQMSKINHPIPVEYENFERSLPALDDTVDQLMAQQPTTESTTSHLVKRNRMQAFLKKKKQRSQKLKSPVRRKVDLRNLAAASPVEKKADKKAHEDAVRLTVLKELEEVEHEIEARLGEITPHLPPTVDMSNLPLWSFVEMHMQKSDELCLYDAIWDTEDNDYGKMMRLLGWLQDAPKKIEKRGERKEFKGRKATNHYSELVTYWKSVVLDDDVDDNVIVEVIPSPAKDHLDEEDVPRSSMSIAELIATQPTAPEEPEEEAATPKLEEKVEMNIDDMIANVTAKVNLALGNLSSSKDHSTSLDVLVEESRLGV